MDAQENRSERLRLIKSPTAANRLSKADANVILIPTAGATAAPAGPCIAASDVLIRLARANDTNSNPVIAGMRS
jgi:hypothetical protein